MSVSGGGRIRRVGFRSGLAFLRWVTPTSQRRVAATTTARIAPPRRLQRREGAASREWAIARLAFRRWASRHRNRPVYARSPAGTSSADGKRIEEAPDGLARIHHRLP